MGRVLLHTSRDKELEPMSMKVGAGEGLGSILQAASKLYSPIRHNNTHIYVCDDDAWAMKG
jgi:hypothetical protein